MSVRQRNNEAGTGHQQKRTEEPAKNGNRAGLALAPMAAGKQIDHEVGTDAEAERPGAENCDCRHGAAAAGGIVAACDVQ